MDIFILLLYAAYPECALLGYWGFLGERGKRLAEHFGYILLLVFAIAFLLSLFLTFYAHFRLT